MLEELWGLPERFLQILWNEGCLLSPLRTLDGRRLEVVHPGTWNVADGPDFHLSTLLLEGEEVLGDVEVHHRSLDWRRHGHSGDRRYAQVMLHVVWEVDGAVPEGPAATLQLQGCVGEEWAQLLAELEETRYPYARCVSLGRCAVAWALSSDACLASLLDSAGLGRLEARAERIRRRCAECGADQALYEAFFDCLGYGRNRRSFQQLTALLPLEQLRQTREPEDLEALLFGCSGLLPDRTRREILPEWRDHVADLWRRFWQGGGQLHVLPWCVSGTRPFNSPERRLAAGIAWLRDTGLSPALWLASSVTGIRTAGDLWHRLAALAPDVAPWRGYRDFCHRVRAPASLLGRRRWLDMMAHVLLPYLLAAGIASDVAREAYQMLPLGEWNRLLTEAAHRFLSPPSRVRALLRTYSQQQGLLDIYQRYCQSVKADCQRCPLQCR